MIAQHSGILAMALVFIVSSCCCCGGFDTTQLKGLLGGDVGQLLEEQVPDIAELLEPTATSAPGSEEGAAPVEEEAVQAAEEAQAAAEAAQATAQAAAEAVESGEPLPPAEATALPEIPDLPGNLDQELEGLLGDLENQLGEGQVPDLNLDCADVTVPLPDDVTECVSVAGFTSLNTNLSKEDINKLYDDYFTGQGWKQFPLMMQGNDDVLNAWQSADEQEFAVLTFMPGQGPGGSNMVGLAVMGNP